MGRMSVATIDAPEFINVTSVNPLISQCEIKVLYTGANRNRSYIDKAAATAIGKTLPGSPIVGYYRDNKKDFTDHGEQIIFDDEGMKVNDLTRPYGFVPTDAKVWFQKFVDTDEFGNQIEREYLMTVGYLWTGQYEEAQKIYESQDGNPQSMKLDNDTLNGHWSEDIKKGVDFFIINDAIIQNLCILGEDVEPCFEGADITAPKISSSFSKDNHFVITLFTMMKELNEALKNEKGGYSMDNQNTPVVEDVITPVDIPTEVENFSTEEGKLDESIVIENQVNTEEFTKTSDEDKKDSEDSDSKESGKDDKEEDDEDKKKVTENSLYVKDDEEEKKEEEESKDKEDEDSKKKYELLEQKYEELQNNYAALEESHKELLAFKNAVEDEKKDALIQQFYMLSDEDKKDVIDNKSTYSLEDIEAKLSVICVRKKVNFDLDSDNHSDVEDAAPTTFNLNNVETSTLPAWLKAVEATKNRNQ